MKDEYVFKIKDKYLQELRAKFNHYSLRKYFAAGTAKKLLEGNANVNLNILYKLSKIMNWNFIDFIEVQLKDDKK